MNKFLAGKIRELSGKAGEPIVGDNRAVIIPVSNNGKFETVPGNALYNTNAEATSFAKKLYTQFYREQEHMPFGAYKTRMVGASSEFFVLSCYKDDQFDVVAFEKAFVAASKEIRDNKMSVHYNKISFPIEFEPKILEIIERELLTYGIAVYIYTQE